MCTNMVVMEMHSRVQGYCAVIPISIVSTFERAGMLPSYADSWLKHAATVGQQ